MMIREEISSSFTAVTSLMGNPGIGPLEYLVCFVFLFFAKQIAYVHAVEVHFLVPAQQSGHTPEFFNASSDIDGNFAFIRNICLNKQSSPPGKSSGISKV